MKWITAESAFSGLTQYQWLDVRSLESVSGGFVSGSLCFPAAVKGIETYFDFLDTEKPICLVTEPGQKELISLFKGKFPLESVAVEVESCEVIPRKHLDIVLPVDLDEFRIDYRFDEFYLVDVRTADQYALSHLADSDNLPLEELILQVTALDPEMRIYLIGSDPDESLLATSYLKQNGIPHIRVLDANWEDVIASGLPVVTNEALKPKS